MSLFKHAMVSGINDALVDRGVVAWPDESVGFEVCSKLASDLSGPDMLPEGGLSGESAVMIGQQLKAASDNLMALGYGPSATSLLRTKQAAAMDFTDRAAVVAEVCMSKAAADASLTNVGPNTAESAAHDDQHAALDLRNRAANKYLMGVGRTAFPNGGVVGQQMVYPGFSGRAGSNSLTSLDKQAAISDRARAMLIGSGVGAVGGGVAGAVSDDENRLRNALIGAGGGAALGAGAGAGVDYMQGRRGRMETNGLEAIKNLGNEAGASSGVSPELMARAAAAKADQHKKFQENFGAPDATALPRGRGPQKPGFGDRFGAPSPDTVRPGKPTERLGLSDELSNIMRMEGPQGPAELPRLPQMSAAGGMRDPNTLRMDERTIPFSGAGTNADIAALLGGMRPKTSNEDMSMSDLGGADPEEAERAMMFLHAMKNRGYQPGPEAQVAAAGLGQAGDDGMEVMAHIIQNVKTASEADDILSQILHHQGQAGELASPELVHAIEKMMAHEEAKEASVADRYHQAVEGAKDLYERGRYNANRVAKNPRQVLERIKEVGVGAKDDVMALGHGLKNRTELGKEFGQEYIDRALKDQAKRVAKPVGAAAGVAAGAYGAKKLYDHVKDEDESKEASLLRYLKAAADGSLTDVGQNTEESAAEHDQVAELDLHNRAANAYLRGVGNTGLPGGKQVFDISKVPGGEAVSNSVTEGTKSAEVAYVNSFRKIASEMGPHLPATMGRDEKVAHLQTMLGLPPNERVGYLKALRAG